MSYFDHFRELRNRLIFCFIFLISIFIISFFYSEKITLTKIELLEKKLSLGDRFLDLEEKHKEWSRRLSI